MACPFLRVQLRRLHSARSAQRAPRQARFLALLCLIGVSLVGCSNTDTSRAAHIVRHRIPPAILVAPGCALAAAEADAARDPACFTLFGEGRSMEPIYLSGTAIVVREQSFLSLRPGMSVVYRSRRGTYVAHVILEKNSRGWIAHGLHNAEADDELVTSHNFVGAIKSAYTSVPATSHRDLASEPRLGESVAQGSLTAALR